MNPVVVLVTRRLGSADQALKSARRQGVPVLAWGHGISWGEVGWPATVPYSTVFNQALTVVEDSGFDVAVKFDDHDEYPDNHVDLIASKWEGRPLMGRCKVRDCGTGRMEGSTISFCAGAVPTSWRATPNRSGRIGVIHGSDVITTGVVKLKCGDWSWNDHNPWTCHH